MNNHNGLDRALETSAGFVGEEHPAFFLQFWPQQEPRAHLIYLPPFAEEMNRCRAMVAAQARWFAAEGLSCSLLDFYGTGESRGDLTTTSLAIWRQNIEDMMERILQRHPGPVYLWGCRLGSLLALDHISRRRGTARKLLLWQPLTSGSAFVTQMLRQRTAALMQRGEYSESTADMKLRLAAGDSLEVAGYTLGGELLSEIDSLDMVSMLQDASRGDQPSIFWLEHAEDETASPTPKSDRAITRLRVAGAQIAVETFTGDPVWQLHKRGACDDLLAKTRRLSL